MRTFVEALGRLGFTSQVLTWAKPFLAPLYSWSAKVPDGTTLMLPMVVHSTLMFLHEQFSNGARMVPCSKPEHFAGQLFRTDAKCDDDKVVLAGWWRRSNLDTRAAPWFSLTISAADAPWLFRENKGSSWASTSAEMLSVIVALHVFSKLLPKASRVSADIVLKAGTDNKAVEALSTKMSSTKIPLLFVMMQLGINLHKHHIRMNLQWRPRELNTEADALTNNHFDLFSVSNRLQVTWRELPTELLLKLVGFNDEFESSIRYNRQVDNSDVHHSSGTKRKKKRPSKTVWG